MRKLKFYETPPLNDLIAIYCIVDLRRARLRIGRLGSARLSLTENIVVHIETKRSLSLYRVESLCALVVLLLFKDVQRGWGGAMVARTTCDPLVASSSLACVTFVFFFWQ